MPVRVWDLPLRLFHWLLVACLIGSVVTIKTGKLDLHFLFGYCALTLILFRILWGVAGSRYARFASFIFSPRSLFASLRGSPDAPRTLGHSPSGALSVFALLLVIGMQAVTGMMTSDEIASEGPLVRFVSNAVVETAGWFHHINERVIYVLVALHVAAILFYRLVKRVSLTRPMLVGDKLVDPNAGAIDPGVLAARDDAAIRIRAIFVFLIAAAVVTAIVNWPAG